MTQRVASIFALSGWGGFCGFSALRCVHEAGWSELLFGSFGARLLDKADFVPVGATSDALLGFSAILAALAIAFGVSVAGLLQLSKRPDRLAEPFAAATFAALFGFYASLALSGSPATGLLGEGSSVTFLIALGLAALLFDHVVADREDEEGDATFEAVMAHLEESKRAAIAKREGRDGADRDHDRR